MANIPVGLRKYIDARGITTGIILWAVAFIGSIASAVWAWCTGLWPLVGISFIGDTHVPLWELVLLWTGTGGALLGLWRRYSKPGYVRRYRRDILDGIAWYWGYRKRGRKFEVINPTGRCVDCDTTLMLTPIPPHTHCAAYPALPQSNIERMVIYCTSCNSMLPVRGGPGMTRMVENHVVPKIEQRIRTGKWRSS